MPVVSLLPVMMPMMSFPTSYGNAWNTRVVRAVQTTIAAIADMAPREGLLSIPSRTSSGDSIPLIHWRCRLLCLGMSITSPMRVAKDW